MNRENSSATSKNVARDSLRLLIASWVAESALQQWVLQAPRCASGTPSNTVSKDLQLVSQGSLTHLLCHTSCSRMQFYPTLPVPLYTTSATTKLRTSLPTPRVASQSRSESSAPLSAWWAGTCWILVIFAERDAVAALTLLYPRYATLSPVLILAWLLKVTTRCWCKRLWRISLQTCRLKHIECQNWRCAPWDRSLVSNLLQASKS